MPCTSNQASRGRTVPTKASTENFATSASIWNGFAAVAKHAYSSKLGDGTTIKYAHTRASGIKLPRSSSNNYLVETFIMKDGHKGRFSRKNWSKEIGQVNPTLHHSAPRIAPYHAPKEAHLQHRQP